MERITLNNWKISFTFQPEEDEDSEYPGCGEEVQIQTVFNGKRNITNLVNLDKLESRVLKTFRNI